MKITDYAFENLTSEGPETEATGAQRHAEWCAYDNGTAIVLTGRDRADRPIRREARSLAGAYATMVAVSGLTRAWHIREDGTRRLAITR